MSKIELGKMRNNSKRKMKIDTYGTSKLEVKSGSQYDNSEVYTKIRDRNITNLDNEEKVASQKVFIVHGHDVEAKETVARYLENLNLTAIILHEQPNKGQTIIEKFEKYSDVGYAVVLLTPDDFGASKNQKKDVKERARQNVIFELGFFFGVLGRHRVCALHKGSVELPSDISGILWISMDAGGAWRFQLAKEMKAAGLNLDLNKLLL